MRTVEGAAGGTGRVHKQAACTGWQYRPMTAHNFGEVILTADFGAHSRTCANDFGADLHLLVIFASGVAFVQSTEHLPLPMNLVLARNRFAKHSGHNNVGLDSHPVAPSTNPQHQI